MEISSGILTLSDRSWHGDRLDLSGPALAEEIINQGWKVAFQEILPDELNLIKEKLIQWCDLNNLDLILTTGGTGFAPRDVTPEATLAVVQRLAPGLVEAMRSSSVASTPHGMLSRSVAGIRGHTLIVNLPGNPKAAVENFHMIAPVLPHAIGLLKGIQPSDKDHEFEKKIQN